MNPLPMLIFLLISIPQSESAIRSHLKIGVNYGQLGDNLPSPSESVKILRSIGVKRVKIYDTNPNILQALSNTSFQVSVMVPNQLIHSLAANQSFAYSWIQTSILPFYPQTLIRYLLVGNEITSITSNPQIISDLVPAIISIRKSLVRFGLSKIKVGTSVAMDALDVIFPPSDASFRQVLIEPVFKPLLRFLTRTKSFFFLDVYPYFAWASDPTRIHLEYALLQNTKRKYTDPKSGLTYTNLLDQMLDAVHFAMAKIGYGSVRISIAETGWPNGADLDQIGGNVFNAATYNRNVVRKLMNWDGSPAQKNASFMPAFLFALYNEDRKPGPLTERRFGLRKFDGSEVYEIDLTGRIAEYPKPLPVPSNDKPFLGRIWCAAVREENVTAVVAAADWACRQANVSCEELREKMCRGIRLSGRASFAFSSYWAKYRNSGASCFFDGLAAETARNPSPRRSCKFPSVKIH